MKITISSRGVTVAPALTARIEKKVGKLGRYFHESDEANVRLTLEKARSIAEITIMQRSGDVLRAEETGYDFYLIIDKVCEKLERQMHKHRTRLQSRLREGAFVREAPEYADEAYQSELVPELVKRKTYTIKPMTVEDAIAQMELLGHTFFAFIDSESNQTNILYQRNDGNYGLLEPER